MPNENSVTPKPGGLPDATCSPSSLTPETDRQANPYGNIPADFARKLERERDELRSGNAQWKYEWDQLREDFKAMMSTRNSDPSYSLDEALDHFYDLHPSFDPENDEMRDRHLKQTPPKKGNVQ